MSTKGVLESTDNAKAILMPLTSTWRSSSSRAHRWIDLTSATFPHKRYQAPMLSFWRGLFAKRELWKVFPFDVLGAAVYAEVFFGLSRQSRPQNAMTSLSSGLLRRRLEFEKRGRRRLGPVGSTGHDGRQPEHWCVVSTSSLLARIFSSA